MQAQTEITGHWRMFPGNHAHHKIILGGEYADEGEPDLRIDVVSANPGDFSLVLAAPDLLKACQAAKDLLDALRVESGVGRILGDLERHVYRSVDEELAAAIAKAKGQPAGQ